MEVARRMDRLLLGVFFSVFLTAAPATAESRVHDGFQLNLALGGSYAAIFGGGLFLHGAGVGGMALAGGTVAPGVVIGGGTAGGHAFRPQASLGDTRYGSESDVIFNAVGGYIDWFPDPRKGLHFLGLVGFATSVDDDGNLGFGPGLVGGIGHQWWIGQEWSFGILGRLHILQTFAPSVEFGGSYTTISPALLASLMFH